MGGEVVSGWGAEGVEHRSSLLLKGGRWQLTTSPAAHNIGFQPGVDAAQTRNVSPALLAGNTIHFVILIPVTLVRGRSSRQPVRSHCAASLFRTPTTPARARATDAVVRVRHRARLCAPCVLLFVLFVCACHLVPAQRPSPRGAWQP